MNEGKIDRTYTHVALDRQHDLGAAIHVFDEVAHCGIFQQLESAVSEARVPVWVDSYVPRFLTPASSRPYQMWSVATA